MRYVGHCPKKERQTEVEELKLGVKSLEKQLGPMLDNRKKAQQKKDERDARRQEVLGELG